MQILVTLPSTEGPCFTPEVVELQVSNLKIQGVRLKTRSLEQAIEERDYSAAIIEISNDFDYEHSLSLIRKSIHPLKIPFVYISRTEFDPATISRFFPDQMLLFPFSVETLGNMVHLFLQKISKGYFDQFNKSIRQNRLWILLKRGVYISLETEEIKYIEAEDHYIKIHSEEQSLPLIKASLSGFYRKHLVGFGHFYALSRSCVINSHKIRKIENNQLFIDPNKPLSIPKGKRDEILEFVGA